MSKEKVGEVKKVWRKRIEKKEYIRLELKEIVKLSNMVNGDKKKNVVEDSEVREERKMRKRMDKLKIMKFENWEKDILVGIKSLKERIDEKEIGRKGIERKWKIDKKRIGFEWGMNWRELIVDNVECKLEIRKDKNEECDEVVEFIESRKKDERGKREEIKNEILSWSNKVLREGEIMIDEVEEIIIGNKEIEREEKEMKDWKMEIDEGGLKLRSNKKVMRIGKIVMSKEKKENVEKDEVRGEVKFRIGGKRKMKRS